MAVGLPGKAVGVTDRIFGVIGRALGVTGSLIYNYFEILYTIKIVVSN